MAPNGPKFPLSLTYYMLTTLVSLKKRQPRKQLDTARVLLTSPHKRKANISTVNKASHNIISRPLPLRRKSFVARILVLKRKLPTQPSVVYFFSQIFWGYGMVLLNQQSNKSIFVSGAMSRKADNKSRLGTFGTPGTWGTQHCQHCQDPGLGTNVPCLS